MVSCPAYLTPVPKQSVYSVQQLRNILICIIVIHIIGLGKKKFIHFSHNGLQKNTNELFGQPIIYIYVTYMEKAMAPHSSTLAWKIPWTEEPGGLQSMRSLRVRHDFTFTFHFHAQEKEMATHSSVLAWRIPGTREPDGLPSMGSHRVGHD